MLSHWQTLFLSTLNQLVLRMGGQQQMFFFYLTSAMPWTLPPTVSLQTMK